MKRETASKQDQLNPEEQRFLERAREKFRRNVDWFAFEDFAFGMRSPIYSPTRSHRDILTNPLFRELNDMWLQLGVRQGRIAPPQGKKGDATRRQTSRRR